MPNIDIVIAHRGPEMGLWMTLASCTEELERRKDQWGEVNWTFYIERNGIGEYDWATNEILENLKQSGHFGVCVNTLEPLSPPSARNHGAALGKSEYIFFLDDHCMVMPGYFAQAIDTFELHDADAVHSVTKFWPGAPDRYHYRFTLEKNFWGYQVDEGVSYSAYQIAAGGHGGWAVKRSVWDELGGYWDGFEGYGGEEMYWELLMGMTDKVNYLNPKMIHWHHPGLRPYPREKSVDFVRNMLMCAHIIGGQRWLERVVNGFKISDARSDNPRDLDWNQLARDAWDKSRNQEFVVSHLKKRTLNEQLVQFEKMKVAM